MTRRACLLGMGRTLFGHAPRAGRSVASCRALATLAIALVLSCGDDGVQRAMDPVDEPSLPPDAAVLPSIKVSNAGAACTASQGCQGELPECLITSPAGTFYPGGYCTADCKSSMECGPGAACPVGDAELADPDYPFTSTWARKCFKSCTLGKNECRLGYQCESLADAYRAPDAPAAMHDTVCVPQSVPVFGFDAGTIADAGAGRDAGAHATDAGAANRDGAAAPQSALPASSIDAGHAIGTF